MCYLFSLSQVRSAIADEAKKAGVADHQPGALFSFFIERVRNNLHIILCMSPVGDPFRYSDKSTILTLNKKRSLLHTI